jgi:hypothetical protein
MRKRAGCVRVPAAAAYHTMPYDTSLEEYEPASRWVQFQRREAALKFQPEPDQLAQAFRVLCQVPPTVKRLPSTKEQGFLPLSLSRKPVGVNAAGTVS